MTALERLIELEASKKYSYTEYRSLLEKLHAEDKTTGDTQTETYVNFSKLNEHRMNRLDKTAKTTEETLAALQNIAPQTWYVITEGWCGDAAQNVPWIVKLTELIPQLSLELVLRDANPEIMDGYLTNGGKSIPKLVAVSAEGEELFTWGPRPAPVQKMVMDNKNAAEPKPYEELQIDVQKWYAKDKGRTFQNEIVDLVSGK